MLVIALLLPSAYLFWQARHGSELGSLEDDGLYLTAARSLVQGTGYKIVSLPGQPYQTKYPPLYPLRLTAIWRFDPNFPGNLVWAVGLNWVTWLTYLGSAALLFRRLFHRPLFRWIAFGLLATHAVCAYFALQIMAEPLFATLILNAIWLATKSSETPKGKALAFGSGLAAGLAFLAKTAALPILVTTPLVFLWKRQYKRAALYIAASAPFAGGWIFWSTAHRLSSADLVLKYYVDYFGFYRATIHWGDLCYLLPENTLALLRTVTSIGACLRNPSLLLLLVVGIMGILGCVRLLRGAATLHLTAFALAYTLQLLMWNFVIQERFLFPLAPLCIAGMLTEACYLWTSVRSLLKPAWKIGFLASTAAALIACFVGGVCWPSPRGYQLTTKQITEDAKPLPAKREAYAWLSRHLARGAVAVAYDDLAVYLYTSHPAIRSQASPEPYLTGDMKVIEETISRLADFARDHQAAYVLTAPDDYASNGILNNTGLREKLMRQNHGLNLVYNENDVQIYSVQNDATKTRASLR